jgi:uncharacterized RDD family membrane protein YckC
MSIKNFFNHNKNNQDHDPDQIIYAGSFRRGSAIMIDVIIVFLIRIIAIEFMGFLWMNKSLKIFSQDFYNEFGTETVKNVPSHIDFITSHQIFIQIIFFYSVVLLIGAFYHAYFNSSQWSATIGKRLMKIMIVNDSRYLKMEKISFNNALLHYFLSILPLFFIGYLFIYQTINHYEKFSDVLNSDFNIFLGFIFIIWTQIHFFTKKKVTAYDLICETSLIRRVSQNKFPWKNKSNSVK